MPKAVQESNRLAKEKSPYLLQHAQNPVDWYPWGGEAFSRAKDENKPIFLSIGYSTCHWCHVMEKESFEDMEVAKLLNKHFVAIKVDREERPGIDAIYMKTCLLMTGSGGWPLTVMMTAKSEPFYAGTYLPRRSRAGRIGLIELLENISKLWRTERRKLVSAAKSATEYLNTYVKAKQQEEELTETTFDETFIRLLDSFDSKNPGFGISPKFPSPHNLFFLLRYWQRKRSKQALEMVEKTLQRMRFGGVFDHVGFGFHRYSTDPEWLVPHFEKMLYDQALMSIAYIEAFQATGRMEYRNTAEEIFEYVLRDMTDPEGGFYSAEDADSEGQEGKFYLWTEREISEVLEENVRNVTRIFNVSREGNYYDEVSRTRTGNNILHLKKPLRELSSELGMEQEKLRVLLENAREKLSEVREKRIHPFKDDKILADWNGLMIAALAKGAKAFGLRRLEKAAKKAAGFTLEKLRMPNGRLLHRYRDGEAAVDANLNDYVFLTWGLIELYEATFETDYLKEALRLQNILIKGFWDKEGGGFFFNSDDSERLLIRDKGFRDAAIPSGNSVELLNLVRLARMTGKTEYEEVAGALVKAFTSHENALAQNTMFATALFFFFGPTQEIVVVGSPKERLTQRTLRAIRGRFLPNKTVLLKKKEDSDLENLAEFTKDMKRVDNKTTLYLCQNFVCSKPITNIDEVFEALTGLDPHTSD